METYFNLFSNARHRIFDRIYLQILQQNHIVAELLIIQIDFRRAIAIFLAQPAPFVRNIVFGIDASDVRQNFTLCFLDTGPIAQNPIA